MIHNSIILLNINKNWAEKFWLLQLSLELPYMHIEDRTAFRKTTGIFGLSRMEGTRDE